MRILKGQTSIDFMAQRRTALLFSAVLIVISLASLAIRGLEFGIDFTGGTLIEVGYEESVNIDTVRGKLEAAGFGDAVVEVRRCADAKARNLQRAERERASVDPERDGVAVPFIQIGMLRQRL